MFFFCSLECNDILLHELFSCPKAEKHIRLLRSKLTLYNFPANKLTQDINFIGAVLKRKLWVKCFSEYLADIDYGVRIQKWKLPLNYWKENQLNQNYYTLGTVEELQVGNVFLNELSKLMIKVLNGKPTIRSSP